MFAKAYHRRATARRQLGRQLEAAEDFEMALRMEPASAAIRQERDGCVKAVMAAEGLEEPAKRVRVPVRVVGAAAKAAQAEAGAGAGAGAVGKVEELGAAAASKPAAPAPAAAAAAPRASSSGGGAAVAAAPASSAAAAAPAAAAAAPKAPSAVAAAAAAAVAATAAQAAMRTPKTSTDFENSWRSFAGSEQLQAGFLRLLVPDQLPSVFKSSLTPQVR